MLRFLLHRSRESQDIIGQEAAGWSNLHDAELAPCKCSCLVEKHGVEIPRFFQPATVAKEESGLSTKRRRDRDDKRDSEAQGMRAGNHQHGDDTLDGKCG